jgi:hypothetical protein
MMHRGDRRHRVLQTLSSGPIPITRVKAAVAEPGLPRKLDRAKTWDTLCQLAENGLARIQGGEADLTAAGEAVLRTAEQAWADHGERV